MKLAFVVPWFGEGVSGGAESQTRSIIIHLRQAGYPVDVFTTCIKDFHADWGVNHHRPGTFVENGVTVHRFPVEPRNKKAFEEVNQKIIGKLAITAEEEIVFADEFFKSPQLLQALFREKDNYLFFFIPYLFPTTFDGVRLVGENSVIIPCLHDEGYAQLEIVRQMMTRAGAHVFNTESESKLAFNLYNLPPNQIQAVLGEGVPEAEVGDPDAFRQKYQIDAPYVLYAGRQGPGKNLPQFIYYWNRFQRLSGNGSNLKLVLIGPDKNLNHLDDPSTVIDLGYISAEDKRDAFAGATAFCHPSLKESFSIVLMEAWQAGRPVLVNGFSPVLVEHVKRSNGGLYYSNEAEFIHMLDWLIDHPEEATQLGENGQRYVAEQFNWDVIIGRYINLIDQISAKHRLMIERG